MKALPGNSTKVGPESNYDDLYTTTKDEPHCWLSEIKSGTFPVFHRTPCLEFPPWFVRADEDQSCTSSDCARSEHSSPTGGTTGATQDYPVLVDITASTGIHFEHLSSPEQKFIVESMSGGVALIDYDHDGWPDIYFTNAQSVEMAQHGEKARSALFHNNRDGTFTDVTEKAGVGYPCWPWARSSGLQQRWMARSVGHLLRRRGALSQQWRRHIYRRDERSRSRRR